MLRWLQPLALAGGLWSAWTASALADEPQSSRRERTQVSAEQAEDDSANWQTARTGSSPAMREAASRAGVTVSDAAPMVRYVSSTVGQASKPVAWKVRDGRLGTARSSDDGMASSSSSARAVKPIAVSSRETRVRQVSDQTSDDAFRDPFGDRLARRPPQPVSDDGPELTAPQAEVDADADRDAGAEQGREANAPIATLQLPEPPRSLPAAPPRAVELESPVVEEPAALATARKATATRTSRQPQPEVEQAKEPSATESMTPAVRSAVYCRRQYNERNCCSDESLCNEHRERVKSHPLSKISIDITPTANLSSRPGSEQGNSGWPFEGAPTRIWRNRLGETLAEGRVTGLANLKVEITNDNGQIDRIPVRQLSEDDICFLAAFCGVPSECRLDDMPLMARNWSPITMTWKASGLCHKPLYFEEPHLERYGHTSGPVLQPLFSSAHFFANIALLPYNMGVHPMNECEYSLGYYRPGVCAPKMIRPFPLSARGAMWETGVVLGGIYLIP